jgi:hypothetical protein
LSRQEIEAKFKREKTRAKYQVEEMSAKCAMNGIDGWTVCTGWSRGGELTSGFDNNDVVM